MSNEEEDYDMIFKIITVGDSGVGKTNLISRYSSNNFCEQSKATVGIEFRFKKIIIDNKKIKAQLWDTAGQERFRSLTSSYYKGGHGALIVYDITDKNSFDNIGKWLYDLRKNGGDKMQIILIGNKSDLNNKRAISENAGSMKAKSENIAFMETSAKNSEGVNEAFNLLIKNIYELNKNDIEVDYEFEMDDTEINRKNVDLNKKEKIKKAKS